LEFLAGLALLGAAVVRVGVPAAMARVNPELALRLAPNHSTALSQSAVMMIEGNLSRERLRAAEELARRAVAQDALSSEGLRTLGLAADGRGKRDFARRLVRTSERLSRRDFIGQLWLLEDAVSRGQVNEALAHYDIALRTSKRAADVLFGPLGDAAGDRTLLQPIAILIAKRPPWANFFLLHVASTSRDPKVASELFELLLERGYQIAPLAVQSLLGRLLAANEIERAWRVYDRANPGTPAGIVRDPGFGFISSDATPFDWQLNSDGSASAMATLTDGQTGLSFEAPVGTGGVVARQLVLLKPAVQYRLVSRVATIQAEPAALPSWRLRCGDDRSIANLRLPASETGTTVSTPAFQIPSGCPNQWLELVLTATEQPQGVHGTINTVRLISSAGRDPRS
jgi:hypothetical protein